MAGTIYLVTNNLNGKQYVGQTTTSDGRGHGQLVTAAYKKYGKEHFSYDIICDRIDNRPTLNFVEKFWIKVMNCRIPNGYNIDHGGSSKDKVSDETRKKLSKSLTGYKHTDEAKANMSAAQLRRPKEIYKVVSQKLKGRKRPAHIGEAVKLAHIGKIVSEETKAKIRLARGKQIFSEETRQKLSIASKRQWAKKRGEI
jgi:NUMOD3 motif